jgi:hypothetical protein
VKPADAPTRRYPRSRTKPRAHRSLPPPPVRPPPPVAPGAPDERQPCQPEAHVRSYGCPACEAWEHGMVLLNDGRTLAKARWVRAHEAPTRAEEAVL